MRPPIALAVFCTLALLLACDGEADVTRSRTPTVEATPTAAAPSATASATSTPSPAPEATPPSPRGPRRTGDPALDAIIELVEARDAEGLARILEWQEKGCTHALGAGGPPKCDAGVEERTEVRVFPILTCEPEWHRDPGFALTRLAEETAGLHAAARPSAGPLFYYPPATLWPPADSVLVFHRAPNSAMHDGLAVNVRDGRIVSIKFGCGAGEPLSGLLGVMSTPAPEVIAGPWHEPDLSGPRRTGDPALDAIIEAVEAHDVDALVTLLRTEEVECRAPADFSQIGSPPFCEDEGVPVGTILTVATGLQCEGYLTTHTRELLERWVEHQDGLYGVDPTSSGTRLVFHGRLGGLNAGKTLSVADGQLTAVGFGCAQPAEAMAALSELAYGPWPEPLTPHADAVRALLGPLIEAVEAHDVAALIEFTNGDLLAHGCQTSRDAAASIAIFLDDGPTLVGIYEPPKRAWLHEWWLVYRLEDGEHIRLVVDARPDVASIFAPCDATLERVTLGSSGEPVPLLWAPTEE